MQSSGTVNMDHKKKVYLTSLITFYDKVTHPELRIRQWMYFLCIFSTTFVTDALSILLHELSSCEMNSEWKTGLQGL